MCVQMKNRIHGDLYRRFMELSGMNLSSRQYKMCIDQKHAEVHKNLYKK